MNLRAARAGTALPLLPCLVSLGLPCSHLQLLAQFGLQLLHSPREHQTGRKLSRSPQHHGVSTIEKLVPKESILFPGASNPLWGWEVSVSKIHVPGPSHTRQIIPAWPRLPETQKPLRPPPRPTSPLPTQFSLSPCTRKGLRVRAGISELTSQSGAAKLENPCEVI